jgi:hypothetical protein
MFNWTDEEAVLYNGIMHVALSIVCLIGYLVQACFKPMQKMYVYLLHRNADCVANIGQRSNMTNSNKCILLLHSKRERCLSKVTMS